MKIIICGAGQVGWQIARHLSSEKNDVTVVDNNSDLVARAVDTLDVNVLLEMLHTLMFCQWQVPLMLI